MNKALAAAAALLVSGFLLLLAQQPARPTIFTPAQAEAGRIAYENTCGQCHTSTLLGRKGDPGERPALSSLSEAYRQFIGPRGFVPPLAGPVFRSRHGSKTAAQLIARFQETVSFFGVDAGNDETTVNMTAWVLQVNGAKAGNRPLTRSTGIVVDSTMP